MKRLGNVWCLLILIAALFFTQNIFAQIPASERQALMDFYSATGGPSWTNNTNWGSDLPVNDWYGITVSKGYVQRISLANNNLTGSIPESIQGLTKLSYLILGKNQLTGNLPDGLTTLSNLTYISISRNQITGPVPAALADLPKLAYIYFDYNQFSGTIPPELGERTNMRLLYLNDNQLTGEIPPSLTNLTKVTYFSLAKNQLTGTIPQGFGGFSAVKYFALGGNQLTGTIPADLGQMSAVIKIHLANNELEGAIPSTLGQLTTLKELQAQNNQLTGSIPNEIGQLLNLERLYLQSNEIEGNIPSSFENLNKLKYLVLKDNHLSGPVPSGMSQFTSWIQFDFRNNYITFDDFGDEFNSYQSNLGRNFKYYPQLDLIYSEPKSAPLGQSLTIETGLSHPNNIYTWYKEQTLIPGANESSYFIELIDESTIGEYSYTVTNTVIPNLTNKGGPIIVEVGAPAETSCTEGNINASHVKRLFGNLLDHVIERVEAGETSFVNYNPPQLKALAPYISSINPGLYSHGQISPGDIQFSFGAYKRLPLDVTFTYSGSSEYDLTNLPFQDASTPITLATTSGTLSFFKIDFCPAVIIDQEEDEDFLPENVSICADCNSFRPTPGKKYVVSVWVKEDHTIQQMTYANSAVRIRFSQAENGIEFMPSGQIIDGWQKIIGEFTIPDNAQTIHIDLLNKTFGLNAYFDDVRIFPFNGNMKSFVYDQSTQRLMAELDENNYATFYEYDQEGGLVRVKKETEEGVYTIQETRSGNVKSQ